MTEQKDGPEETARTNLSFGTESELASDVVALLAECERLREQRDRTRAALVDLRVANAKAPVWQVFRTSTPVENMAIDLGPWVDYADNGWELLRPKDVSELFDRLHTSKAECARLRADCGDLRAERIDVLAKLSQYNQRAAFDGGSLAGAVAAECERLREALAEGVAWVTSGWSAREVAAAYEHPQEGEADTWLVAVRVLLTRATEGGTE